MGLRRVEYKTRGGGGYRVHELRDFRIFRVGGCIQAGGLEPPPPLRFRARLDLVTHTRQSYVLSAPFKPLRASSQKVYEIWSRHPLKDLVGLFHSA